MQTVILAGGLATRLHPATLTVPKSMVDVGGKPFLAHQLELLRRHGYRRVVLCVGHMHDVIEMHFGDGSGYGMSIQYSYDGPTLLGTGGALVQANELLDDQFFVINGDSYLLLPYRTIAEAFRRSGRAGLMVVYRNNSRFDRSNVAVRNGLVSVYEQHGEKAKGCHLIDAGLLAFRKDSILEGQLSGTLDLGDILARLAAQKELAAFQTFQRFYEIGSPSGLAELRSVLGDFGELDE